MGRTEAADKRPSRVLGLLSWKVSIPVWVFLVIALAAVAGSGIALYQSDQRRHGWLEITKDPDGTMVGLLINPRKMPADVVSRLPDPHDLRVLNADEVRRLADKHGFLEPRESNPHLCFGDGDLLFWVNRKRPAWELELEFLARELVLDAAERTEAKVLYQGDLSKWGERVYPILAKKALEKL